MITATDNITITNVKWDKFHEQDIQSIYAMLREQEGKIFDLTFYDMGGNLLDYIENYIRESKVFLLKVNGESAAFFILDNLRTFGDVITRCEVHTAIKRKFWGKTSRELIAKFKDYLFDNYYIKKIIAYVPQNGYGVIKLLKDVGFTHEGTLKNALMFPDKNNKPKYYDELIYSLNNEEL